MRRFFLLLLLCAFSLPANAQSLPFFTPKSDAALWEEALTEQLRRMAAGARLVLHERMSVTEFGQGSATVSFRVDERGRVYDAKLTRAESAGQASAALSAVRALELSPPPRALKGKRFCQTFHFH